MFAQTKDQIKDLEVGILCRLPQNLSLEAVDVCFALS